MATNQGSLTLLAIHIEVLSSNLFVRSMKYYFSIVRYYLIKDFSPLNMAPFSVLLNMYFSSGGKS